MSRTNETNVGAWALWHPERGFGDDVTVHAEMDVACEERNLRRTEADGRDWRVVPVRVVRVDNT